MQRAGEDVRRQSKSSQECGPSWARERRATSSAVRCWLSPDQSYVRDPNQRTVFMPAQIPGQRQEQLGAASLLLTREPAACTAHFGCPT